MTPKRWRTHLHVTLCLSLVAMPACRDRSEERGIATEAIPPAQRSDDCFAASPSPQLLRAAAIAALGVTATQVSGEVLIDFFRAPVPSDSWPIPWIDSAPPAGCHQCSAVAGSIRCRRQNCTASDHVGVGHAAQIHFDCDTRLVAIVLQPPLPSEQPTDADRGMLHLGFQSWLTVTLENPPAIVAGCVPGWSRSLAGHLGMTSPSYVRVASACSPPYFERAPGFWTSWSDRDLEARRKQLGRR